MLLSACETSERLTHADRIAEAGGMKRLLVAAGDFTLTAYVRLDDVHAPIDIYIEGDGRAWRSATEPSSDPTPRQALGLELAAADPAANVIYIARPCQFTPHELSPHCDVTYWTSRRYSEDVVASMDEAVTSLVASRPDAHLNLIGYSGGGAVAILVAARRHDVATIRTVAGNLDTEEVNRLHGVSPMPESLNPVDSAAAVSGIPQIHFSGGADEVVPAAIAERFRRAAGGGCILLVTVRDASHEAGWPGQWRELLTKRPECGR